MSQRAHVVFPSLPCSWFTCFCRSSKIPLSLQMWVSGVGLTSSLLRLLPSLHCSTPLSISFIQIHFLVLFLQGSSPSSNQSWSPPLRVEECLCFGLNNDTTPPTFSLNSKAPPLPTRSSSSLTLAIIQSIIQFSALLSTWIVSLFWRYSGLVIYFLSDISFSGGRVPHIHWERFRLKIMIICWLSRVGSGHIGIFLKHWVILMHSPFQEGGAVGSGEETTLLKFISPFQLLTTKSGNVFVRYLSSIACFKIHISGSLNRAWVVHEICIYIVWWCFY